MLLVAGCLAIGYAVSIQVLQVGDSGPVFRVAEGEVFSLSYTQSMYNVPVTEKFRIENGRFILFHVISSEAALEYLGIERKEENNVRGVLAEFLIPRASIGKYALMIRDSKIELGSAAGQKEAIRIRLAQMPFIIYASQMWR
jgi:hypothetical protein